jgi:hypothetical protein
MRAEGKRMRKHVGLALGLVLVSSFVTSAAPAAVICQKETRIKFRVEQCKPGWIELAKVGAERVGGPDPSGIWEYQSGTLFDVTRLSPRFLVLEPDGAGRLNLSPGAGGVLTCGTFNYARDLTPTLTLDLQTIGYLPTSVYRYGVDGDALELHDSGGRTAEFTRADAVAPDAECGSLTEVTLFTGLPMPEFFGGLGFDGAQLWYEVEDVGEIVPIDPAAGTAGTQQEFGNGQFTHLHAYDDGAFWTHCGCGGSEEAARVSFDGAKLDQVDTEPELGEELGVRAIAFDPASKHLWLFGHNEENQGRLFEVDPAGEPDVLVQAFDLDADFSGLAFDGTNLWGLHRSGQSLARIDPTTGAATGNFKIPNRIAQWRGVAVVGSELALLGDTGLEGAILKVSIPAP